MKYTAHRIIQHFYPDDSKVSTVIESFQMPKYADGVLTGVNKASKSAKSYVHAGMGLVEHVHGTMVHTLRHVRDNELIDDPKFVQIRQSLHDLYNHARNFVSKAGKSKSERELKEHVFGLSVDVYDAAENLQNSTRIGLLSKFLQGIKNHAAQLHHDISQE